MAVQSNRSASLNMEGINVPLLTRWLASLPVEAQKSGTIDIRVDPYFNQFDRGSTTLKVEWHEDLATGAKA